ncbi:unnamed protein product [Cyclocybe aegerita]|uniref:Uncharacterized protein n=1 Tax=Cyclocybe aegerita TaxID=1973307 RepID=A0A8S0W3F0_CYCAE|nr:unnamed protein product [Cyclocybe aegerita]
MSKDAAIASQVTWNPDITINMQSANGQIEKSCGLAKNVPFRLGQLTMYLQVHVMEKPAYRVLLGRPFDVLTESEIKNLSDGGQIITITDPNTKERCVVPTYARGENQGECAFILSYGGPGDVQIEAYTQPKDDKKFSNEELRTTYLSYCLMDDQIGDKKEKKVLEMYLQQSQGRTPTASWTVGELDESDGENPDPSDPLGCFAGKKYKPVGVKVKPVLGDLPKKYRIKREIKGDPLASMPALNPRPPDFEPTG